MKKVLFTAGVCVLVGVLSALATGLFTNKSDKPELGGVITENFTNSVARIATASSTILATNTARQYAKCQRLDPVSAGLRVDVSFGSTASKNYGFPVYASGSFEIIPNNLGEIYIGPVTGVIQTEVGSTSLNYGRWNCVEGTY